MTSTRSKLFDLDAVPAKEILRNKARVCPPVSALCELVDNVFDNYEENDSQRDLAVSLVVRTKGSSPSVSLAENSGGVRKAKLEPLVKLGMAYHGAKGSIGIWGEGLKVALFSLGGEIEILTAFPGETPVTIHFEPGWLDSPDWRVPVYQSGPDGPPTGSTVFNIGRLAREVDWAEIMRELAIIYGHKIDRLEKRGRRARIEFDVDGSRATLRARPLASIDALRQRLAFPPDFAPRVFQAEWPGQNGPVRCHLTIGLTARHSGETSGVYLYGNGRLFARALRTRAVGYGESGNALLRDHPSCWRIHAYAFFEADDGADIPWQAPLKDGVSENHPITSAFRQMLKDAVAPYSRFAKVAKASELVPYTSEWQEMTRDQRAELMFGKHTSDAAARYDQLPTYFDDFQPPVELETFRYEGVACETALAQLEDHARYARTVIAKRDAEGPRLQEDVLRALNPHAFSGQKEGPTKREPSSSVRFPRTSRVAVELKDADLARLRKLFGADNDKEAVGAAVRQALRAKPAKAKRSKRAGKR